MLGKHPPQCSSLQPLRDLWFIREAVCSLSFFIQQHMAGPCRRDWDISGSPLSVETMVMVRRVTMDTHSSASVARMVTMDASTLVLPMSSSYTRQNLRWGVRCGTPTLNLWGCKRRGPGRGKGELLYRSRANTGRL